MSITWSLKVKHCEESYVKRERREKDLYEPGGSFLDFVAGFKGIWTYKEEYKEGIQKVDHIEFGDCPYQNGIMLLEQIIIREKKDLEVAIQTAISG